ncbi:MAG: hypothetical protein ACRC10_12645 [Thermoguttaceae bacterium]
MTETMLNVTETTPELTSFEARLAQFEPVLEPSSAQSLLCTLLFEQCQLAETTRKEPITGDKLVETIVTAGKSEVTMSLTQYTRSIRLSSALLGIGVGMVLGVSLGCLFCYTAFKVLTPPPVPTYAPFQFIQQDGR